MVEIFTDGASRGNPGASSYAFIFVNSHKIIKLKGGFIGFSTNNIAEYTAILEGLKEAMGDHLSHIAVYSDSLLVISQLNRTYRVKSKELLKYYNEIQELIPEFKTVIFRYVGRENHYTKIVDYLCTIMLGPK